MCTTEHAEKSDVAQEQNIGKNSIQRFLTQKT